MWVRYWIDYVLEVFLEFIFNGRGSRGTNSNNCNWHGALHMKCSNRIRNGMKLLNWRNILTKNFNMESNTKNMGATTRWGSHKIFPIFTQTCYSGSYKTNIILRSCSDNNSARPGWFKVWTFQTTKLETCSIDTSFMSVTPDMVVLSFTND